MFGGGWMDEWRVCFFGLVSFGRPRGFVGCFCDYCLGVLVFVWIRFKVRERQLFYKIGPPQVIEWSQRVINYNNSF